MLERTSHITQKSNKPKTATHIKEMPDIKEIRQKQAGFAI
jgi:hypothetical protein